MLDADVRFEARVLTKFYNSAPDEARDVKQSPQLSSETLERVYLLTINPSLVRWTVPLCVIKRLMFNRG